MEKNMFAELTRDKFNENDFRVEAMDHDGGCEVAIFSGPNAQARAEHFAAVHYPRVEKRI